MENTLYYGDNLEVLRHYIPDESIDLIYLDPPFKSNQDYNILFKEKNGSNSTAQIKVFEDTWHWDQNAEETFVEITENAPKKVADLIIALRGFLGSNDMMAYLVMMAIRLIGLHGALKDTGSIYLHCDPTASHYLKLLMDAVFGVRNFRNELVWKRKSGRVYSKNSFGQKSDTLLFYAKTDKSIFNHQHSLESARNYIKERFTHVNEDGRKYRLSPLTNPDVRPNLMYEYKGHKSPKKGWAVSKKVMEKMEGEGRLYFPEDKSKRINRKIFLDEYPGHPISNLWDDIPFVNPMAKERLGYPTQKPEALLVRIIKASSNHGEIILDPFCGCGTTITVAEKLKRKWIGIDVTHLAISLMRHRLRDTFGDSVKFEVIGEPVDIKGAEALAKQDPYQFQWWATGLVGARPAESEKKKGGDKGIDGHIYFHDEYRKTKKILIQVKSGKVLPTHIRDLKGTIESNEAQIGVFITLQPASRGMKEEAVTTGFYKSPGWNKNYPRLQILTIKEILQGKTIDYPPRTSVTFKKAEKHQEEKGKQLELKD